MIDHNKYLLPFGSLPRLRNMYEKIRAIYELDFIEKKAFLDHNKVPYETTADFGFIIEIDKVPDGVNLKEITDYTTIEKSFEQLGIKKTE